uniref:Phosphoribosylformylglycinamidine synthase 1 n=1 Tax=Lygus hesperus TaxID=30085 RepID=A0A0A9XCA6_LYGHE
MAFNLQAKLAECALFTLMLSLTVGHQSSVKRVEIDLLRLMDGNFAPTTLSTTLTLDNGTAIAVFSGDNLSYQIDSVYIMLANASEFIVEVEMNKSGTSKLATYWAPFNSLDSEGGEVKFFLNNNSTWLGNATIKLPPIGGDLKYAMAAKLSGGDPEDCSSYLCTYSVQNAALAIPDRFVLDKYQNVNGGW